MSTPKFIFFYDQIGPYADKKKLFNILIIEFNHIIGRSRNSVSLIIYTFGVVYSDLSLYYQEYKWSSLRSLALRLSSFLPSDASHLRRQAGMLGGYRLSLSHFGRFNCSVAARYINKSKKQPKNWNLIEFGDRNILEKNKLNVKGKINMKFY